ncbi:MAG: protein translocase subunit SecF [Candidatus Omnitrophica bacterium]|nr:protein translocase subunit SecF [Candidatus Omnitrophota bacterium]MCM8828661.1 protein translocase subunit SecF [Candidatus Omnitrophota bacterium]
MELIKNANIDFLGKRKWTYIFSLVLIVAGMIVFGLRGKSNFGVDFVGGDLIHIKLASQASVASIRSQVKNLGITEVTVQEVGMLQDEFIIKSPPGTSDRILESIEAGFGREKVEVLAKSVISPSMSVTLRKRALTAFFVGLIGILLYLTIRFEFHFAVCATIAIFHDLLVVLAILALSKKIIDGTIIAALLTIAGYSVNDTIVIFDRIRENLRKTHSKNYFELFNQSINETLSRTILTVLTVIFVDILLLIFGGEPLKNFAYTLLFGFLIGTYSSIFVASAILIDWQRKFGLRFKL